MAGAGQIRGRRGIIGGYWGGYSSLSSSPTPRALPGKVENLTPPANGKNAPDGAPPAQAVPCWNVASRNRCAWISASASSPAPERGADPSRPRYAPGRTRRSRSHRQCRQKARAAAHHAPPPWPFSFAPPSRLPPARPAGSAARHALGVAAAATMTTPAPRSRSRSHRPPPAPGRISTASAAPDDHASSRPPPTMTTHKRQPCPTCTAPTACQPCQTSQQQRSRQRRHRGGQARQRRPPAAACIAAACRMIHPAAPRKTAILRRRRRGQILHLTG